EGIDGLLSGVSTRLGGVSKGDTASMNLSFGACGDSRENVLENYRRLGEALGFEVEQLVATRQVHSKKVTRVGRELCGNGILKPNAFDGMDGLVTDEPGVILAVFMADCVPILFVDPVRRAVGACHSGWRGTVQKICQETVNLMEESFGTKREELIACIGPSICQDCYEVDEPVREAFLEAFPEEALSFFFAPGRMEGRYQLSLWEANRYLLKEARLREENIHLPGICPCCNPQLLFSHRASQGRRGVLGAFVGYEKR
ncbi:MAG: peptidoglycan editing factor PgeF, partial [Aeriscardovia sp.]|nr:peptidoglycan editing factor PgeF [Aeriscardovia sp.]